jgi:CBS domain-containing protein
MTVEELAERISGRLPERGVANSQRSYNLTDGLPIVSEDGHLAGIVTQGDLLRALENDPQGQLTVLEAGSNTPIVAYPDELAHDAMYRMLKNNIGRMPVVSREDPRKMVGYFNRSSLLGAWSRKREEEELREHGWLRRWRAGSPDRSISK